MSDQNAAPNNNPLAGLSSGAPSAPQAPAPAPSPFGSGKQLPAASASSSSTPTPPKPPVPAPRLGAPPVKWRLWPTSSRLVRFELAGMGDPFYRLLNRRLNIDFTQSEALYKALQEGGPDVVQIVARCETAWNEYKLSGAVLLYRWSNDLRGVLAGRPPGAQDDENAETYDDEQRRVATVMRALDMVLVLNVLARTRVNILLHNAPLALEGQYLRQSLYTDDPRLLELAEATGWIEETVVR